MSSLALVPAAILVSVFSRQLALREATLWGVSLTKPFSIQSDVLWALIFWLISAGLCISNSWQLGVDSFRLPTNVSGETKNLDFQSSSDGLSGRFGSDYPTRLNRFIAGPMTPADVLAITFSTIIILAIRVDLTTLTIPDLITGPGLIAGLTLSIAFPEFQLVSVWGTSFLDAPLADIDFPASSETVYGEQGRALLRWFAGASVGSGVIWLIRIGASWSLRTEALGFGDVTLMAAVGGLLGWQATLLALLLSPVPGIGHAALARCFGKAVMIPFGPSLGLASLAIAWNWSWIWPPAATYLNDPMILLALGGMALGGFAMGMLLLRVEKIPQDRHRKRPEKSQKSKRQRR